MRLGTPAGTTRGFGEAEFQQVGEYIVEVLDGLREANSDDNNAAVERAVRDKVKALTARFPIYQAEGRPMRCPYCGNDDTQVKDSRPTDDSSAIRRRRICPSCGGRFTTFERVQLRELTVVKKSGRKVPFDREKLARSVYTAVRKRNIDSERVERLISGVVRQLESLGEVEITSEQIGECVMEGLKNLDDVAFVRFASVYKNFGAADDFRSFLSELKDGETPDPRRRRRVSDPAAADLALARCRDAARDAGARHDRPNAAGRRHRRRSVQAHCCSVRASPQLRGAGQAELLALAEAQGRHCRPHALH